jgi:hypothetical protein
MGEDNEKTSKKRPVKPFKGAVDGVPFTSENQPSSEAKRQGWQKVRADRILTQMVLAEMTGDECKNLKAYVKSLIDNAKNGNSKAIETINKCMEEDVIKIAQTDSEGNDIDVTKLPTDTLSQIELLLRDARTDK